MEKELIFPEGFLWGAATSSYQVEGGIDNCNWSKDFPAGKACDYWNRYEEYFELAQSLGQNIHRLSLEWSRIEPEEGKFDRQAIEHYKKMLMSLRKRKMKTMVTLWHSTNPCWFSEKGGWTNFSAPSYFQRYTAEAVKELDEYVDIWVTINEPGISTTMPYLLGMFPPRHKYDVLGWGRALYNLAQAHKKSYRAIKQFNPEKPAGMAENYSYVEPLYKDPLSLLLVRVWDFVRNGMFLRYTKKEQDFIGVNYYFHERLAWGTKFPFVGIRNRNKKVSDRGHEIYPRGLYMVLKGMKRYGLPIYITENGLADKEDSRRADFIREHLRWTHRAMEEGADVRGYLHWSLLDNFEWEERYGPCYGLVAMDFERQTYELRPSAKDYARICLSNKLTLGK